MTTVIVPPGPGLLCALGLLVADIRTDFSRTCLLPLHAASVPALRGAFAELDAEAGRCQRIEAGGGAVAHRQRALDMRYLGQSHEFTVPVPEVPETELPGALAAAFRAEHGRVYGYASDAPMQAVTARLALSVAVARRPAANAPGQGGAHAAPAGPRRVWFKEAGGRAECPVLDRAALPPGSTLSGPVIIEQMDTTTVLHPGMSLRSDAAGNLIIAVAG